MAAEQSTLTLAFPSESSSSLGVLVQRLHAAPPLRRLDLEALPVGWLDESSGLVDAIAASAVADLTLSRTEWRDAGVRRFSRQLSLASAPSLRRLALWACRCSEASLVALSDGLASLPIESVRFAAIGSSGVSLARQLAALLASSTTLTALVLTGARFDDASSFSALFEAARTCSQLRELHVGTRPALDLDQRALDALAALVASGRSLHTLQCSGASCTTGQLNRVLDALDDHNTTLTKLFWATHPVDDDAVTADALGERRVALLERNERARWCHCHELVATVALGLAPLELPAYVVLEIVDQLPFVGLARHWLKIRALVLVQQRTAALNLARAQC